MRPLAIDAIQQELRSIHREAQAQIDRRLEFIEIQETGRSGGNIFERYEDLRASVVLLGGHDRPELEPAARRVSPTKTRNPSGSLLGSDLVALQDAIDTLLSAMDRAWPN